MPVPVRRHVRRHPVRPVSQRAISIWPLRSLSRTDEKRIPKIVDEIRAGKRSGFTYSSLFKFDINDVVSMRQTYNKLGDRTMYVVATTNRRLEDLDLNDVTIGGRSGLGFWKRDIDGAVFADDITLFFSPEYDDDLALEIARQHGQEAILKVDGSKRSFEFISVT